MKRTVALLLLAAMLFSVLAMAGCPSSTPNKPDDGPSDQIIDYGVGEHNFGGESVKISCLDLFEYEIYSAESTEEFIEDAVFKRNRRIEQAFNVEIEPLVSVATGEVDMTTHYNEVLKWMNSGEPVFDILAMYAFQAGKLVLRGEFYDLRSDYVPYVSTSINNNAEWWPTQINRDCTINGHQFLGVSDLCLTAIEMCYAVIFNKNMEEDNNIATGLGYSNLYEVVDDGRWTLDVFYGIVKDRFEEADGSTSGKDENDIYGLAGSRGTDSDAWAFSLGFKYIKNDGESTPELWDWTPSIVTAIEDLRKLYNAKGTYTNFGGDYYSKRNEFFANNHALFNLSPLMELKSDVIHNMEADFGVLPYPKLNEQQKMYKTGTLDHYTMLAIPTFIGLEDELTRTAVVLEALSKDTCLTVKEGYYDVIVKHKNTTDEDSVRMIELIMDGRTYDITTYHYDDITFGGTAGNTAVSFGLLFRHLIGNTSTDPASFWTANRDQLEYRFNDLITQYNQMGSW